MRLIDRLLEWWNARTGPRFSYVAHEYLRDVWVCTLCRRLVHPGRLNYHAAVKHDFAGEVTLLERHREITPLRLTEAERESVRADVRRLRGA